MTAYQREKVQTIHTCGGPLWCVYICSSLCRVTNRLPRKRRVHVWWGGLGEQSLYTWCVNRGMRAKRKRKGGEKRKENSPSKKNTWKINKKRHINNGKSTVDSLQFNLFILWKYKGPREERKGKAYGQACTFWWAPSWLGRDARIIYTRIQTPTLTENLYSDDEALYWLECRFHQPLTLPLHSHTHTQFSLSHMFPEMAQTYEERAKDREQPFTHCTDGGKGLRQGKLNMKQVVKQWGKRAVTNRTLSLSPGCGHACGCVRSQSWLVLNVNVQPFKGRCQLTQLTRIVRETITTNTGNIWNWLFWLRSVNEILQRPKPSLQQIST